MFVDNATSGVTAVLRSLPPLDGGVLFTTDHAYQAVKAALDHAVRRTGARLVVAKVPFPLGSSAEVLAAIDRAMPDDTRLAVFDEITVDHRVVFPVPEIVALCRSRGIPGAD